jgi:hypothetical protein
MSMIETKFYYRDEEGQETETRKTYTESAVDPTLDGYAIDVLTLDFVQHLKSCGFTENTIKNALTNALDSLPDDEE